MMSRKIWKRIFLGTYILIIASIVVMFPIFISDGHDRILTDQKSRYIPATGTIHGIDISRHNGLIDWEKVTEHRIVDKPLKFVIMKASEGSEWVDPMFGNNWEGTRQHNFIRGAYHFYSMLSTPEKQAENYLNTVNFETGDFVPVLDFEIDSSFKRKTLSEDVSIWLQIVESETGKRPVIYTNHYIYNKYIKDKINDYDIWLADYSVYDPSIYNYPNLLMWQHTDGGQIPGINHDVDLNVFYGSPHKFEKYLFD